MHGERCFKEVCAKGRKETLRLSQYGKRFAKQAHRKIAIFH